MVLTELYFNVKFIPLPLNTCGNLLVPVYSVFRRGTAGKISGGFQGTWNYSAGPGGKTKRWKDLMYLRLL